MTPNSLSAADPTTAKTEWLAMIARTASTDRQWEPVAPPMGPIGLGINRRVSSRAKGLGLEVAVLRPPRRWRSCVPPVRLGRGCPPRQHRCIGISPFGKSSHDSGSEQPTHTNHHRASEDIVRDHPAPPLVAGHGRRVLNTNPCTRFHPSRGFAQTIAKPLRSLPYARPRARRIGFTGSRVRRATRRPVIAGGSCAASVATRHRRPQRLRPGPRR